MKVPHGLKEIVDRFGDPSKFALPDGTLSPTWEKLNIVRVELPEPLRLDFLPGDNEPFVTRVACHKGIADVLRETLEKVHGLGLWAGLGGYSGGFAWRPQRDSNKLSTHAWGIGLDFGGSRDPLGDTLVDMPPSIVEVFDSYGFTWGGRWKRTDAMHFQFASDY